MWKVNINCINFNPNKEFRSSIKLDVNLPSAKNWEKKIL